VDQQTNDPNAEARTALARRSTSREPANLIRDLIERQKPEIARALIGTALDPERFARIAFTAIRQSPQLMRCRPESLLGALMTAAQLGLEPGPLGEAWLVPFKDQVTFIVGYRGLLKLAWQSGQLRNISARVVYEADDFDFAFGLEPRLEHRPARGDRGAAIYVYAAATLLGGGVEFEVLSVEEVEAIRGRSAAAAARSGPWVTDWAAMARKTAVRQLARWLPLVPTVNRALMAEGQVRTELDPLAMDGFETFDAELVDDTASQSTPRPPEPDSPPQDSAKQATTD
jgi:recombination protein RecT